MRIAPRITLITSLVVTLATILYARYDANVRADERAAAAIREAHTIAAALRPLYDRFTQGRADDVVRALDRSGWALTTWVPEQADAPRRVRSAQISGEAQAESQPRVALALPIKDATPNAPVMGVLDLARTEAATNEMRASDFKRAIWLIGLVAAAVTLAVGLIARTLVSRRIQKLLSGIDDVAKGDLSHVLLSDRDDEIGAIAVRFNDMTQSLRESRAETARQNDDKLRLEQRLGQTERLATLGQLAAEIAHEMGTPLNVIAGRARATQKRADDPAAAVRNAQIIAEQTARVTRIIQRLVDFARKKVGTPANATVQLDAIAQATMELLAEQFARGKIKNRLDRSGDLPLIRGDADRLQQVLINLLMNAIQAMPDGGAVTVTTRRDVRHRPGLSESSAPVAVALLRVSDTGPGIPEAARDKIFDAFYTTKGEAGTGLGLAVCHGIVKEHDGWIEITDAPGGGACIDVYLPTES